jgi:MFS family permease
MAEQDSGVIAGAPPVGAQTGNKFLFWACFISLIATSVAFVTRLSLLNTWVTEFNLSITQSNEIAGAGIWPFAVSIILFSFVVDKIGYKTAMIFAFVCHIAYGVIVICAPMALAGPNASPEARAAGEKTGYWLLYIGSFILALSNGTVEAVANPVVATMFSRQKIKWLSILHAGWPAGLVAGGLLTVGLAPGTGENAGVLSKMMGGLDWRWTIGMIFIPAVIYGIMMIFAKFPIQERVAAGVSYMEMLKEFGILASIIVVALVVRQVGIIFSLTWQAQVAIGAVVVVIFALIVRSPGRVMLFVLMLIMMPLAVTELGTDGSVQSLMEPVMRDMKHNPAWVVVYTSLIMMILRFCAGAIVHRISPLALLAISSAIAAIGLYCLSLSTGMVIFVAATLYALGKSFFWPTMLGTVSEQCPKGGALTLNAVGGMGMLAVGVLGFPFIGQVQDNAITNKLKAEQPGIYAKVVEPKTGIFGGYEAIDQDKLKGLIHEEKLSKLPEVDPNTAKKVKKIDTAAKLSAMSTLAIFPCVMFCCYVLMLVYFKSKGGYKAVELTVKGGGGDH